MINRRDFCACVTFSSAAGNALPALADDAAVTEIDRATAASAEPAGVPASDYTPFGYLDNPWHTWDLHHSGIFRSLPGIGFALYYPAGPGGYFDFQHSEIYEAHLALRFRIGTRRFNTLQDFASAQLTAPHHSKNLFTYQFEAEGVQVISTFVQVSEDALGLEVQVAERAGRHQSIRILASHTYKLGAAQWWGRDGLTGDFTSEPDGLWIRSFAAGTVFAIAGNRTGAERFLTTSAEDRESWLDAASKSGEKIAYFPQALHGGVRYDLELAPNSRSLLTIVMARGTNRSSVLRRARASVSEVSEAIARKRDEDASFWNSAPMLAGDWPKCWKHGWVYDFETLRMMVRRPIGLYKNPWDAMQIQAPRNVLAETSIDMWALSYAAPAMAKAVFEGQFLDALQTNVPCMRETGVMNMVAADGSECGTSISWCFPFFCAASIFDRTHDIQWLRRLYPGLAALLRWTLANRIDSGGFLVGKCSWETGMDTSKRFLIQQPTGGELVEFLRLVELQAAAAHAGGLLARFAKLLSFAKLLNDTPSIKEWEQVKTIYTAKTQQLWNNDWFHDFDTRSMQLVTAGRRDPSQAAPAFCGVATAEQKARMLPALRQMYERSKSAEHPAAEWDDPLAWSSFVLPYLEAVWSAGDKELAGQVVTTIADRIYGSMDRRSVEERSPKGSHLGWPGISCEIWGAQGAFGGEGYGWGAVMPAHIIRNLIGFRETDDPNRILICPNLPSSLAGTGKRYGINGLHYGSEQLHLHYRFIDDRHIQIEGQWSGSIRVLSVSGDDGSAVQTTGNGKTWRFDAVNHGSYIVQLSGLDRS